MTYKDVAFVMQNGMILYQEDIAKIVGTVYKSSKRVPFEIDLHNGKDVYNLVKLFGKDVEQMNRQAENLTKQHSNDKKQK